MGRSDLIARVSEERFVCTAVSCFHTITHHLLSLFYTHNTGHGKIPFTELAKLAGQRWNYLSEARKAPYKEVAEIDRARYSKEKAHTAKALKDEAKKKRKERKEEFM